jgi:hypothetical protein
MQFAVMKNLLRRGFDEGEDFSCRDRGGNAPAAHAS